MNTSEVKMLNQVIKCGKPIQNKQITFVVIEELGKNVKVVLQECEHPEKQVIDKFNQHLKNTTMNASSMNDLKDQLFDILEFPRIQNGSNYEHKGYWKDQMRINGVTINTIRAKQNASKNTPAPEDNYISGIYYIYIIKGKDFAYIGMTSNFKNRESSHKRACSDNLNKNFKTYKNAQQLYTAINNNGGWENVEMYIVETIRTDDSCVAREKEQEWIDKMVRENPNTAILNKEESHRPFVKCSHPFCSSKTRRVCNKCENASLCKKHTMCLGCKDLEEWKKKEIAKVSDEKEFTRENARNAYRIKKGIPLDAPLIQRGGARNVKYHTPEEKEERQKMGREYQKEYQKKYREKKMLDKTMMMEITDVLQKNIQSPVYVISFFLESLKNKKQGKSYSDVE